MKKLLVLMMIAFVLVGCGNTDTTNTEVDNQNVTDVENTETEEVTTEPKTIEAVPETEEETEIETEEVVEEVKYSYTDMDKTMYAKQSVNVRDLPSTDGNKLGGLSLAQEVHVTGQCTETSWYRIEFDGAIAYVSNSYLVDEKPQQTIAETSADNSGNTSNDDIYTEANGFEWGWHQFEHGYAQHNYNVNRFCACVGGVHYEVTEETANMITPAVVQVYNDWSWSYDPNVYGSIENYEAAKSQAVDVALYNIINTQGYIQILR